ncbi:hypothetical protein SAMN05660484_02205 [Eubacterium ruminantium]|uniref:Uncharacterized protein n=1 Tax=Eubacterium ruminantium TaxID=42322 RepID=A0A1T4Q5S5_9FIRM|nr:hypothetical protein [Eubacterium ruminantium]SCW63894.1 hypothetical protein SAMN05660484_02205 [Eubacterium ruminantium]SDN31729.1 hypothetical protein SAMN04490370_11665 [Eubacterium ruminantium]SJZ99112.1 hypothetical protein SAMN02745110_02278 [Eubacterium ruminantium]
MFLSEFLNEFDFCYETSRDREGSKVYQLIDNQGADLGGIEGEDFYSIEQIVDRLGIYYHDYIYEDICEEFGYEGKENYDEILEWLRENHPELKYFRELVECIVDYSNIEE